MSPRTSSPMSLGSPNQQFRNPTHSPIFGTQDLNASGMTSGQRGSPPLPSPMSQSQSQNSTSEQDSTTTDTDASPPTYSDALPDNDLDIDLSAYPMDEDPALPSNDDDNDEDDGGPTPVRAQTQAQGSSRLFPLPGGDGRHGSKPLDPTDPNYSPALKFMSSISGPPPKCRLKGCNNPVFVDKYTRQRSDYCSQRHREDAVSSKQVGPCIMCGVMPRSREDHFCSRTCRDAALHS